MNEKERNERDCMSSIKVGIKNPAKENMSLKVQLKVDQEEEEGKDDFFYVFITVLHLRSVLHRFLVLNCRVENIFFNFLHQSHYISVF